MNQQDKVETIMKNIDYWYNSCPFESYHVTQAILLFAKQLAIANDREEEKLKNLSSC